MDKRAKLSNLYQIRQILAEKGIHKIFYATNPAQFEEKNYANEIGFWRTSLPYCPLLDSTLKTNPSVLQFWRQLEKEVMCFGTLTKFDYWAKEFKNKEMRVELNKSNEILLNGKVTDVLAVKHQIQEKMKEQKGEFGVFVQLHPDANYQSYISLMENVDMAYLEIWQEAMENLYGVVDESFEYFPRAYRIEILKKYPRKVWESFDKRERKILDMIMKYSIPKNTFSPNQ